MGRSSTVSCTRTWNGTKERRGLRRDGETDAAAREALPNFAASPAEDGRRGEKDFSRFDAACFAARRIEVEARQFANLHGRRDRRSGNDQSANYGRRAGSHDGN